MHEKKNVFKIENRYPLEIFPEDRRVLPLSTLILQLDDGVLSTVAFRPIWVEENFSAVWFFSIKKSFGDRYTETRHRDRPRAGKVPLITPASERRANCN